ncbi:MAG TPA: nucleoside monophosphate kinase [Candidatus Bathyarchaeia archaeon]|nr:nucleoside monophosphate kinase [Candidatus Bathyarchaeia archaeon]
MNIVILGPPGSGKGTYATLLESRLGIPHVSTGDLVREEIRKKTPLGDQIAKYSNSGNLVPDETITELLKCHLSQENSKGFILEGYPRSIQQAKLLETILKIDVIINLNLPDSVIVDRLSARTQCKKCGAIYNDRTLKPKVSGKCDKCSGDLFKRVDDQPKIILERLKVYQQTSAPVVDFYRSKGLLKDVILDDPNAIPNVTVGRIIDLIQPQKI